MAASLLRYGQMRPLKCLQVEIWGILRSQSVVSFCTQTGDPAKPAKKTKATSKTKAQDERDTLLTYKTAVSFPVRLSQPEVFLTQSLGVAESKVSPISTAQAAVASAATAFTSDDTAPAATGSSAPSDRAPVRSSSSSFSDSDSDSNSDSDSDSEDEKSEVKAETKTSPPELSELTVKKEAEIQKVRSKATGVSQKDKKEVPTEPEHTPVESAEAVQENAPAAVLLTIEATVETPGVSSEELVDSAAEICTATEDAPEVPSIKVSAEDAEKLSLEVREHGISPAVPDTQTQTSADVMIEAGTPEKQPTDVPIRTTQTTSAAEAEDATTKWTAGTTAEVSVPVERTEALVDCAPVVAAGEKLQEEAGVEPSEEAVAAPTPEPDEPFDNSTYKNYQHHSYTPYTFVDMDVEMAKFRLPQPSSGRP